MTLALLWSRLVRLGRNCTQMSTSRKESLLFQLKPFVIARLTGLYFRESRKRKLRRFPATYFKLGTFYLRGGAYKPPAISDIFAKLSKEWSVARARYCFESRSRVNLIRNSYLMFSLIHVQSSGSSFMRLAQRCRI